MADTCTAIANKLRNRRPRLSQWASRWVGAESTDEAVVRDWKRRHEAVTAAARLRSPRAVPAYQALRTAAALEKRKDLRKHESSLLTQNTYGENRATGLPVLTEGPSNSDTAMQLR
jgi:hypothetical protein